MTPAPALLSDASAARPSIARLAENAAAVFGVPLRDMLGPARFDHLVRPRKAVALLAMEAGFASNVVARALGRRNHTTILHARRCAIALVAGDPAFAEAVRALRAAGNAPIDIEMLVLEPLSAEEIERGRQAMARGLPAPARKLRRVKPKNRRCSDDADAERRERASELFMAAMRAAHPERCAPVEAGAAR